MTMQFELLQETRITKMKNERRDNIYDNTYKALDLLVKTGPLTKYRISNKKIINHLISNGFIETTLEILAYERGRKGDYYRISKKGLEYMKTFENLQKLFD